MADKNLRIKVSTPGAKKAKRSLGGVEKGLGSLAKKAGVAAAAFFGARALISGFKAVVDLAGQQEMAERKLEAVLKSTSHAAGLQANELKHLASSLQTMTTFGDEAIIGAQSLMLTFTSIGKEVFPSAIETVLNMSTAMGTDLQSSVIQLGKALNDPVKGVAALTRVGVQLTDEQINLIKAFDEVGNTAAAQKVILGELETQFGGLAEAAGDTMAGKMQQATNAIGDAGEKIGSLLAPAIINVATWFATAAKNVGDFFQKMTETSLETSIRQLEALGVSTLGLQLSYAKIEKVDLDKLAKDLENEDTITKNIANSNKLIEGLMLQRAEVQLKLAEGGKEEDELRQEILDKQSLLSLSINETGLAVKKEARETIRVNEAKLAEIDLLSEIIMNQRALVEGNKKDLEVVKTLEITKEHILALEEAILEKKTKQSEIPPPPEPELDTEAFDAFITKQQEMVDAKAQEADWLEIIKTKHEALARAMGLVVDEEEKAKKIKEEKIKLVIQELKQAALVQGSAKDAMKAVVRAESMEAVAGHISSIFQTVPLPLSLILAAGAGAVVSGIIDKGLSSFAQGGDFVTSGPQMIMVGDNPSGRERVQVTPSEQGANSNLDRPANIINVNISGGIVQDDYIRNELLPAINKVKALD